LLIQEAFSCQSALKILIIATAMSVLFALINFKKSNEVPL